MSFCLKLSMHCTIPCAAWCREFLSNGKPSINCYAKNNQQKCYKMGKMRQFDHFLIIFCTPFSTACL